MRRLLAVLVLALAAAGAAAQSWEKFFEPFLGSLPEEAAASARAGKKALVVMYHFEECPACARMKREVLSQPEVQKFFRQHFHAVAIDTLGAQEITGFDGRTMAEKDYARAAGVRATPTFVFHGADGKVLFTQPGGVFEPREFILLGEFVASGAYRSASFASYRQSRQRKGI